MEKIYANVMIAKVYNNIIGEMDKRLIVFRDGKVYEGALFFPLDADDMIMEIVSINHVEGTVWDVMNEAYAVLKVNGMLAKDEKTLLTMLHWQYINGFSKEMFLDIYKVDTDEEYIRFRRTGENNNHEEIL